MNRLEAAIAREEQAAGVFGHVERPHAEGITRQHQLVPLGEETRAR